MTIQIADLSLLHIVDTITITIRQSDSAALCRMTSGFRCTGYFFPACWGNCHQHQDYYAAYEFFGDMWQSFDLRSHKNIFNYK
jgi:hypothetical protein